MSLVVHLLVAVALGVSQQSGAVVGDAWEVYHRFALELRRSSFGLGSPWSEQLPGSPGTRVLIWITALISPMMSGEFLPLFVLSGLSAFAVSCLLLAPAASQGGRFERSAAGWFAALTPSVLVWAGLYGKDAITALGLALVTWTLALRDTGRAGAGARPFAVILGLLLVALGRPHIATLAAGSLIGAGVLVDRSTERGRGRLIRVGLVALGSITVGALLLSGSMRYYLEQSDLRQAGVAVGGLARDPGAAGQSGWIPPVVRDRLAAVVEPTPWNVRGAVEAVISLEHMLIVTLVLVTLMRRRGAPRSATGAFALLFGAGVVLLMGPLISANTGLLSRHRAMMLVPVLAWLVVATRFTPAVGPASHGVAAEHAPPIATIGLG
jgi:hypothetical protein